MDIEKTVIAQPQKIGTEERIHYLAVVSGPKAGERFEIPAQPVIIGRSEEADLSVRDPAVSGRHCRISMLMDTVMVEDLGSKNGTFIDESQVTQAATLPVGAVLQVGNTLLKHEYRSKREMAEEVRLAEDLEKAAGYVRSLLPAPLTEGPVTTEWRFIPSEQLGGDAFGYHWLDEGRFAVYLLDVCGHGAAAALHSVAVLNVLRKQSIPGVDFAAPAQVLSALNRAFSMAEHAGMYFTMWYGVYDTASRRLGFASAGHPPALLQVDGEKPQEVSTPNLAIGLMETASFSAADLVLPPESRLYLYSDGAYEVETESGEEWRLHQFLEILAQERVSGTPEPERVEAAVRQVMKGAAFDDDFSVLVTHFH